MRRLRISAAALLLLAQRALSQEPLEIRGADGETVARVAEIAAIASSRGLPVDPVINEARFAALNRVNGGKIVVAARGVAERLETARAALQPNPSAADIAAGAEALKYGISADVLRDIRRASKGPLAVPIGVLTQLVSEPSNMKVKRAAAIVLQLVRRGAETNMIADLGNKVADDVALGMSSDQSLAFHLNGLQPLLGPVAPGSQATTDAFSGQSRPPAKKP